MTLTTTLRFDPSAEYEVASRDIEYRRTGDLSLMVRIYQPRGAGPFPALIALHGGAWAAKDWLNNEQNHEAIAAGGAVVAAIQFRTSEDAPHPAAMEDISYATRWLKAHAPEFSASAEGLGGIGWSSGGHQVMLAAMRPRHYATIPLNEAPAADAGLAYVIMGWPVIDPVARFGLAQSKGNEQLVGRHLAYFGDEAGMAEASPPHILARGEAVETPPALLLQGAADEALTRMMAEEFVEAYSLAGGVIELAKYPGAPHGFLREPGPNRDRGLALIRSFIARQL
jgi:acetyl esterase/lipase